MNSIGLLVALILIVSGVAVLLRTRAQRQKLHLPAGTPVYLDTTASPGELLFSERRQLKGRPDLLLHAENHIIPVEAKTGKTPTEPYFSHIMQLIAYCILVEENYGVRPPHGVIRYPEQNFVVEFTPEMENRLLGILTEMRQMSQLATVHRKHNNANICEACGFRDVCDERLDIQLSLFD